jgi:hypothetical protein
MITGMDDPEIERLRKSIRKTFAGQPHKVKYWLALLDMFGRGAGSGEVPGGKNFEGGSANPTHPATGPAHPPQPPR